MNARDGEWPASQIIQCTCGAFQGRFKVSKEINRGICYCASCQAFAHYLGRADEILDERGGSDVIQTLPKYIEFTQGQDKLACMRLTEKGLLRWYASCCNTPIGNTPPGYKVSFVGFLHNCLAAPDVNLDDVFGPVRMYNFAGKARGEPKPKNTGLLKAALRFIGMLSRARLNGSYKQTPFFDPQSGTPVQTPKTLSSNEYNMIMKQL